MVAVEICLEDIESAIAAQQGGANRIELCDNLTVGGTTPSIGMISQVRKQLEIELQVIIRPRGGDFCYSDTEFSVMKEDIEATKSVGADGIVTGLLNPDGTVDAPRTDILVQAADPIPVTFHRAFDHTKDPFTSLELLVDIGVSRILSSGKAPSAIEGLSLLRQLQETAQDRISIMAGGGVSHENVQLIINRAQIQEIHAGSSCTQQHYKETCIQSSDIIIDHKNTNNGYPQVSAKLVSQLVTAVHKAQNIA